MNREHLNNKRYANSIAPQSFKPLPLPPLPPRANFLCHKIRKYTRVHSRTRVFDHSTRSNQFIIRAVKNIFAVINRYSFLEFIFLPPLKYSDTEGAIDIFWIYNCQNNCLNLSLSLSRLSLEFYILFTDHRNKINLSDNFSYIN